MTLLSFPLGAVPDNTAPLPVQIMMEMFEQPIHFHPWCAKLTGSAIAGLWLSYALRRTQRLLDPGYFMDDLDAPADAAVEPDQAWFLAPVDDVTQETGMSKFEQQSAKRVLRNMQLLDERLQGLPAQKEYRVNTPLLMTQLQSVIQERQSARRAAQPPATRSYGSRHTHRGGQ